MADEVETTCDEYILLLPCYHVLCYNCLKNSIKDNMTLTCPLCNEDSEYIAKIKGKELLEYSDAYTFINT